MRFTRITFNPRQMGGVQDTPFDAEGRRPTNIVRIADPG